MEREYLSNTQPLFHHLAEAHGPNSDHPNWTGAEDGLLRELRYLYRNVNDLQKE